MAADAPQNLKHSSSNGNEYRLTLSDDTIQIERYSSGSIAGGSDTECGHTVAGLSAIEKLLNELEITSLQAVFSQAIDYNDEGWENLHSVIQANQTSYYLLD